MTPPPSTTCTTCEPRRTRPAGTSCGCRPTQSGSRELRAEPRDWTPWWTSLAANA